MLFTSTCSPVVWRIKFCAISIMVKLRSPKKSNFTSPISSTSPLSNIDTGEAFSSAWYTPQKSEILLGAINTPPACMPRLRVKSSSFMARLSSSSASSSRMICSISGSAASASFKCSGLLASSGMSLDKRSHRANGSCSTRPTSRITALDDIAPKVTIWLTACLPYFSRTYSITRPRLAWQKSISKSGMDTRSGFKNRSNSSAYLSGSKSVILSEYATSEPAPEPRPGPTGQPWFFAQLMKSCTMRK